MKIKIPKLNNLNLKSKSGLVNLAIIGAVIGGVWYFGLNPSTRKVDLLGMLHLDSLQSMVPQFDQPMTAPSLPMDAIPVTDEKVPVAAPESPVDTVPVVPSSPYRPIGGAYATSYVGNDAISVT